MLNKLLFNNLVISNKTKIQQGRIQTVNKLVQKIRKLKSLLEKYPQVEKNKERLRKWTLAMEHVKKLKRLDLMRNVLVLEKTPTAVLTNGLSTPDEMAVAILAMNKIVQDLAQTFKEQLQLSAEDKSWREEIMQTSKRRSKINRTEQKRQKRKEVKEQKAIGRKRTEWLSQNKNGLGFADGYGANGEVLNTSAGAWKVEELTEEETTGENVQKKITTQPKHKETAMPQPKFKSVEKPSHTKSGEPVKSRPSGTEKTTKRSIKTKNLYDNNEEESKLSNKQVLPEKAAMKIIKMEPKGPMTSKSRMPRSAEPVVQKTAEPKALKIPKVTYVVDPFFITETGENYLSTAVVLPKDVPAEQKKTDDLHKPQRREFKARQNAGKPNSEKWNPRQAKPAENIEKLHPSWAAKQKLKATISNFQGKKITFDDDGPDAAPASKHQSAQPKTQAKAIDNLHPSWVAKQKLKPTITAFQGKKITFGDDE